MARFALCCGSARWSGDYEIQKIIDNGPTANRVNIVVLGDGYVAEDIDTVYAAQVQDLLNHVFLDVQDPFPRYHTFFNVFRIDVVSNERRGGRSVGRDLPGYSIGRAAMWQTGLWNVCYLSTR